MAAPVIATSTTASRSTNGTTLVINKPSGVVSGDLLLIAAGNETATDPADFTALSGWTKLTEYGSSLPDTHSVFYWRIADGTEGTTFTIPWTTAGEAIAWCFRITGAHATTPINASAGGEKGALNSYAYPTDGGSTLTTSVVDTLQIAFANYDGGDDGGFTVTGTGWTEFGEQRPSTAATSLAGCIATRTQAATGNATVVTFTCLVNDGWSAALVAIAPAATGDQTLTLPTIASGATQHAPTVTRGAVSVTLPTIASGATQHSPTVLAVTPVSLPHITSGAAQHNPTVTRGPVTVTLPAIGSAAVLHTPTVSGSGGDQALTLPTIASGTTQFAPSVAQTVTLPTISSSAAQFTPTVTRGPVTLVLPVIGSTSIARVPTVTRGPVAVTLPTIAAGSTVYAPTVRQNIVLPVIASGASLFAPTVVPGAVTLSMPTIASGSSLFAPSLGNATPTILLPTIYSSRIYVPRVGEDPNTSTNLKPIANTSADPIVRKNLGTLYDAVNQAASDAALVETDVTQLQTDVTQLQTDVTQLQTDTAKTAWTAVAFQNSWVNYDTVNFSAAQYRKEGDRVYVRGMVGSGTLGVTVFNLPAGYRPPKALIWSQAADGGLVYIQLNSSGDFIIVPYAGATNTWVSINADFSVST